MQSAIELAITKQLRRKDKVVKMRTLNMRKTTYKLKMKEQNTWSANKLKT